MVGTQLTLARLNALIWLYERNGDGVFDRNGVVLAAGQSAPFERKTWNGLANGGLVEFYGKRPDGSGRGRLRLTEYGRATAAAEIEKRRHTKGLASTYVPPNSLRGIRP